MDRRPPDLVGAGLSDDQRAALDRLGVPLILLVGGATGTGKSTVTVEVAHRLGITRVSSTDTVRQTMRAFFSREFMPSIHASSFEAPPGVTESAGSEADPCVPGFLDQTRNVLVGVRAVLERAVEEGYSLALEGVHLVPGLVDAPREGALVCQCLLAISDEEEHARHFWVRDAHSEGLRPVDKYLRALPAIRSIQAHLLERAARFGVPVIENRSREEAVAGVVDLVLASASGPRRAAGAAG
jgi:2-phosphoglycerate kinase